MIALKNLSEISRTLFKSQFWHKYSNLALSEEQRKVLNRLLDGGENGFEHGISASQYQKVAKISKATATRHLSDLLEKNVSSNWKVVDVIHAIRSILSYRYLNNKKPNILLGFFTYLVQIVRILLILEKLINRASMYYSSIIEFFIVYINIDSFNL
jgi:hypothetical protein